MTDGAESSGQDRGGLVQSLPSMVLPADRGRLSCGGGALDVTGFRPRHRSAGRRRSGGAGRRADGAAHAARALTYRHVTEERPAVAGDARTPPSCRDMRKAARPGRTSGSATPRRDRRVPRTKAGDPAPGSRAFASTIAGIRTSPRRGDAWSRRRVETEHERRTRPRGARTSERRAGGHDHAAGDDRPAGWDDRLRGGG
jgi:hypothetical protein